MTCSYLTRHPSGLIPIPFGLSESRPVKLLSFSFFPFSVSFGKISSPLLVILDCLSTCLAMCMLEGLTA